MPSQRTVKSHSRLDTLIPVLTRNSTKADLVCGIQDVAAEGSWNAEFPLVTTPIFSEMASTTGMAIRERVTKLEKDVSEIKRKMGELDKKVPERLPSVTISPEKRSETKAAILKLFQENDVLDYVDIRERVDVDLFVVVDICNELEREGKILPVAE